MAPDLIKSQADVVAMIRSQEPDDVRIELGYHGEQRIWFHEGLWALVYLSTPEDVIEAARNKAFAEGRSWMPESEAMLPRSPGAPEVSHTDREEFLLLLDAYEHVGWERGPWKRRCDT